MLLGRLLRKMSFVLLLLGNTVAKQLQDCDVPGCTRLVTAVT
jgi:hypothetical protein